MFIMLARPMLKINIIFDGRLDDRLESFDGVVDEVVDAVLLVAETGVAP